MWTTETAGIFANGRIYKFDYNAETESYGVLEHCCLVCYDDASNANAHNVWHLSWQMLVNYTDGESFPRVGQWGEPIETIQARANAMIRAELEKVMQKLK